MKPCLIPWSIFIGIFFLVYFPRKWTIEINSVFSDLSRMSGWPSWLNFCAFFFVSLTELCKTPKIWRNFFFAETLILETFCIKRLVELWNFKGLIEATRKNAGFLISVFEQFSLVISQSDNVKELIKISTRTAVSRILKEKKYLIITWVHSFWHRRRCLYTPVENFFSTWLKYQALKILKTVLFFSLFLYSWREFLNFLVSTFWVDKQTWGLNFERKLKNTVQNFEKVFWRKKGISKFLGLILENLTKLHSKKFYG